ncbi:uncharacterized protein BcabD6B2_47670 [Babesia caballi]|uniref:Uncharacterized protein n=1 Tax=Babesia caballi TaxID=5871 RepID=A0AAV4LYL8_BABCB|nr:hypothetical protein, conserved [Babesia caballi]
MTKPNQSYDSLTDPPTNLKEAIDWVLRINELKQLEQLAEALNALLKRDVRDMAVRVKEVYEKICEKFCKDCEEHYNHASYLKQYLKKLPTFEPFQGSDDETDEKMLEKLKGDSGNFKSSLSQLPDNLKKFLGYTSPNQFKDGIISSSHSYTFVYQDAEWNADEATDYAVILLAVVPMLFLGLGYTYVKCSQTKGTNKGWSDMKIKSHTIKNNGVSAFGDFLTGMGFHEGVLNGEKSGSEIHSQLSDFNDLKSTNASLTEHPYSFFKKLQNKALTSQPTSPSHPLTTIYRISHYCISYPLYTVQSSNPVTPSFLGYSGPAALAGGAYGFNLGGINTFMSALLA